MEKLHWKTEVRKLSDLIPVSYNPRSLSDKQAKDLKKSLLKFSLAEIPVINLDNTILAGHQRCKILAQIENKDFEIDVRVPNRQLTPEEADEYLIRSNKNSGEFDFELLENHFSTDDLVDWGFDEDEFEHDVDDLGEVEGEDDVPDAPEEPVTKLGDVWLLGSHRLLCGDSTNITDVDKLMDGQKANMVFNDPPYGMNYDPAMCDTIKPKGEWCNKVKNYSKVIGDDKDYDPSFLMEYFKYCKEQFWWGADYYAERILKKNKGSWIVWDKRAGVEDLQWTTSEFELCWSKQKHHRKIARIRWHGLLGMEKDDTKSRVHPTQKPADLAKWFFEHWGKEGDLVVDLYGGSGSTLIACEKTKRKCFMSEIDPKYCDVIIKRWQEFTGNEAVHAESGKKYNELLESGSEQADNDV